MAAHIALETEEVWSAALCCRLDSEVDFRADDFASAAMYAVFQRHTVLSYIFDDVDSVHFSRAIRDARCGFTKGFIFTDALNTSGSVEFINVIVAFVILSRSVEDSINSRVNG